MTVRVDTNEYQFSHSKTPRGGSEYTPWYFRFGEDVKSFNGKYSEAKKQAVEYAKSLGLYSIKVCP